MKKTLEEILDGSDYILDDSKMPSPEQVANFPKTPELDKKFEEDIEKITKEFSL